MLFVRYYTCTFLTGPIHSGLYATRISYQHYIEHLFSFYCQIFRLEQLQQLVRYLETVIFFFPGSGLMLEGTKYRITLH